MNPLIFYRVKKPVESLDPLPLIDISKCFDQLDEESKVAFSISKLPFDRKAIEEVKIEDENTLTKFN